jgi:hypothetical protein
MAEQHITQRDREEREREREKEREREERERERESGGWRPKTAFFAYRDLIKITSRLRQGDFGDFPSTDVLTGT